MASGCGPFVSEYTSLLVRERSLHLLALRTIGTSRTVSRQIQLTCDSSNVFTRTYGTFRTLAVNLNARINERTELAKSPLIVRALNLPLFWVGVQALITSRAISILGEPPTLGHASEVVLVEKLTSIPFLTKASEPVLTYGGKSLPVSRVSR
jgi:hypothetical protein